jgi:hypothetical protein
MSLESDNSSNEVPSELETTNEHSSPPATPDVEVDKKINPLFSDDADDDDADTTARRGRRARDKPGAPHVYRRVPSSHGK